MRERRMTFLNKLLVMLMIVSMLGFAGASQGSLYAQVVDNFDLIGVTDMST